MRRICISIITSMMLISTGYTQDKTYQLQPGQAFDLLLLNTNEGSEETMKRYFGSAVAVASEYGYTPQKGLRVNEAPLQGNYWPAIVILGIWQDYEKRHAFVDEITERVPDFHKMRRDIWSPFLLTYWEVEEAHTFVIKENGFYVMTAHWMNEGDAVSEFKDEWSEQLSKSAGQLVLEFTDGSSPDGYQYNPELLTISSWKDRQAFLDFQEQVSALERDRLNNIHQVVIQ